MSDYSIYSTDELKAQYKCIYEAYMGLDCLVYGPCSECPLADACKELKRVKTLIYLELLSRKSKGASNGEEKENRS